MQWKTFYADGAVQATFKNFIDSRPNGFFFGKGIYELPMTGQNP